MLLLSICLSVVFFFKGIWFSVNYVTFTIIYTRGRDLDVCVVCPLIYNELRLWL